MRTVFKFKTERRFRLYYYAYFVFFNKTNAHSLIHTITHMHNQSMKINYLDQFSKEKYSITKKNSFRFFHTASFLFRSLNFHDHHFF